MSSPPAPGRSASCPPAPTYALYLDGGLSHGESRSVEAHLVGCRRCRELVLALRERGAPAHGAGDAPAEPAGGAGPPTARHALALPLTLVALAGLVATATALLEWRWSDASGGPEALGASWRGAYAMAIDLIFVLRESAPAFFDLALPVAAMASASALLSFGLSALRRRIGGPGAKALAALALLALPGESRAHFGLHEHEEVVVPAGSVHPGTLVTSARSVTVDGVVDGDLVVLTERLVVRGELAGNLFAVAREVDLRGIVDGSLFIAGERASLDGEVRGDVYAGGETLALAPGGRIARDATLLADRVLLEGEIGRDANVLFADSLEVRSRVGRDLRGRAERIALADGARIGRDAELSLPEGVAIERLPGAQVAGELRAVAHDAPRESWLGRYREPEHYAWMLLHVGAGFVLGMLLHRLAPGILALRADTPRDLLRGLGIGLAALAAAPVALAVAAATVVGLPVALIGAAAFAAALYVGLVAVAGRIGTALLPPGGSGRRSFAAALAAGLTVLVILTHLPFLGPALRVVAVVVGLGLLVERAHEAWRAHHAPALP